MSRVGLGDGVRFVYIIPPVATVSPSQGPDFRNSEVRWYRLLNFEGWTFRCWIFSRVLSLSPGASAPCPVDVRGTSCGHPTDTPLEPFASRPTPIPSDALLPSGPYTPSGPSQTPGEPHQEPGGNLIPPEVLMMLWGLPVRPSGANRRNTGTGGAVSPRSSVVRTSDILVSYGVRTSYVPGSYGVRTSGVLVSYGVRMGYVRGTYGARHPRIGYRYPIQTLSTPYRRPTYTLSIPYASLAGGRRSRTGQGYNGQGMMAWG